MEGGLEFMEKLARPITWVETACVKDNQVLSLSVNRQDVERCARVIRQYDLLTPPVVGDFPDGTRLVLSGEFEFLALREMGVRSVEAVAVPILEGCLLQRSLRLGKRQRRKCRCLFKVS